MDYAYELASVPASSDGFLERMRTHLDRLYTDDLTGKIFLQFISFQLLREVRKRMQNGGLMNDYSVQSFLDELDAIEGVMPSDGSGYYAELYEKQMLLFDALGVDRPPVREVAGENSRKEV